MSQPEFLERDVVLFLHDQALREFGGMQGIREGGLLDSALGRPPNKLAYADPPGPDLFDLAASYAFGIASNHPFNDGNKRTAWACCMLFLLANGCRVHVATPDAVGQVLALVERHLDETGFALRLRTHAC